MENELVNGGSRVDLDNASRVSDLHRGGGLQFNKNNPYKPTLIRINKNFV